MALETALDRGITFIDTADVYGDGRSEQLIARVLKSYAGPRPFVATKAGRRLPAQTVAGYTKQNLTEWIERSLRNLEVDSLDLVQLHCPPTALYYQPETFAILDDLKAAGKVHDYGVSVERIEEAIKAIEYPGVVSIQIIYNILRQRPHELLFELARKKNVRNHRARTVSQWFAGGNYRSNTTFDASDHRQYNRHGEAFDVGETFSGVPYDIGLAAVERVRTLVGGDVPMAQFALRWILMSDAVTVAIPGARNGEQAQSNAAAAGLPALDAAVMAELAAIYDRDIRPHVHQRW